MFLEVNALMCPNYQSCDFFLDRSIPYFYKVVVVFLLFFFQYCLIKDVVSSLKKHRMHEEQFKYHPLLILNNFGQDGMHIKLMATMFQNMFPSINVHKVGFTTKATAIFFPWVTRGLKPH